MPTLSIYQAFRRELTFCSHPNTLSHNLLANLLERSGKNVIIRAGGSTANIALFNESQPYAIENFWNGSTNVGLTGANTDQPSKSLLGPAWFEAFRTAPEGTQYVYDLNYRDNSTEGVAATLDVAKRVYKTLGKSLRFRTRKRDGQQVEPYLSGGQLGTATVY